MKAVDRIAPSRLLLISLLAALFIIYPNITWLPYELGNMREELHAKHLAFFVFRYLFCTGLIFVLCSLNLKQFAAHSFRRRLGKSALISLGGYLLFGVANYLCYHRLGHFGSVVLFQVFVICILSSLLGYISHLYKEQRSKEQEIERLKMENLQSRYDALTNQINPHFFFNSLNGLTSLIRKREEAQTLTYVNKLSDVFRYILQSDKKGMVRLEEELQFIQAFRYMLEVRFANKLHFDVEVAPEVLSLRLPVLSILPLIDNVVVHNRIDSENKMVVTIRVNPQNELVVSNPTYPKLYPSETNGTGLENLKNRFHLLVNKAIRIEQEADCFSVCLPLTP